jgi:hypothetical protein
MNGGLGRIWEEAVMAYLNRLPHNLSSLYFDAIRSVI